MTIETERERQGREPFEIVEADLDFCFKDFGQHSENLFIHSEEFDDAVYLLSGMSAPTPNTSKGADGTLTADTINDATTIAVGWLRQTSSALTIAIGDIFTGSVFVEKGTSSIVGIRLDLTGGGSDISWLIVDLDTLSFVTTGSATVINPGVEYISNGIYRIYCSVEATSAARTTVTMYFYPAWAQTLTTVADITATGTAQLWGFQANKGALKAYTKTVASTVVSFCNAGSIRNGTAQAGTTTTITLDSGASAVDDEYNGFNVVIVAGTGSGQGNLIVDYQGANKRADVLENWSVAPDNTSEFKILNPLSSTACYNTRATCQDTLNYLARIKTYRFCTAGSRLPAGEKLIPCLLSSSINSPVINLNQSVGLKGSAKITLQDFTHHDRGVDPYVEQRDFNPETQGTFFGKFRARNLYHQSRPVRVYKGFFTEVLDLANFDKYEYFIDRFEGLNKGGKFVIVAKDPLKLAGDERAKCPVPTTGTISVDITAGAGSLTLLPSGIGDEEYPTGAFKIRSGDEIMSASRVATSDVLTLTARGQNGTTADSHDAGDNVQVCKEWIAQNVVDVVEDLLNNFTTIDSIYIDAIQWAAQKAGLLSLNIIDAIISEPEGVESLLNEIVEANLINIFWNDRTSLLVLNSIIPESVNIAPPLLTQEKNFIGQSVKIKEEPKQRISRVRFLYAPRDATKYSNEAEFKSIYLAIDSTAEGVDEFGEVRIKTIKSRWFSTARLGLVIQTATRILNTYRDNPFKADFILDPKDAIHELGAGFRIDSRQLQDADGTNRPQRMKVTSITPPAKVGGNFRYSATSVVLAGKFAFIAPAGTPVFSLATDEEKEQYGFIAQADGTMLDGSDGYLII